MTKYVYLYKITLKKKRQRPLYYFGIRTCSCLPEEDSYMGSPITYADLWKDESYVKTKEILKYGVYDEFFETFRDEEPELIKEGWEKYGLYGKDKKGSCLNACAGKMAHPFFNTGENNPSKKPEVRAKLSKTKKQYYKDNPEARAKISKSRKQYCKDNPEKNPLKNPESRAKLSKTKKQYYKDNPEKNPSKNPEARAKMSKSIKKYFKDNPDKHPMRNPENIKKRLETMKRKKMLRLASQKTTQPLEDFFQ